MCGRFTQAYTWQEVHDFYDLTGPPRNLQPNYNIAPAQTINMIVAGESGLELQDARWGLMPPWWKSPLKDLPSTFNARSETAAGKPMFRSAFKHNRCLIPATGFYEWKRLADDKQPYHIAMSDGSPMTFAGLWERWSDSESSDQRRSCTILTTEPNDFMKKIHGRMPVILSPVQFDAWLDDADKDVLVACNDDLLTAHPVNKAVGNVHNNFPELLQPIN